MYKDGKIWVAQNISDGSHLCMLPQMANRHGLIAGATGTGKTVTLKVMAESFSAMGVPVFMADVKGDLAGCLCPGEDSESMQERIGRFGLEQAGFTYHGFPVTFWDIYGEKGIPLRTTISEMGPLLLSRILNLNDLQSDIMNVAFKIADDQQLLLVDTKDLKALLNYISDSRKEFEADYGRMSPSSISAIIRAVVSLETAGADKFFGETALNITDWFTTDANGHGMIHILDAQKLITDGRLYSTFLLWMMSELFETLPEVGDPEKPRMVFFFDEAHLLFKDASDIFLEKIEQVVKLIRSKGVGIYFCTQNPRDIPDGILSQLGNKVEHALHAYTPSDQKAVKAAAMSFRENPEFSTYDAIMSLGTGEAVVSFLDEKGVPGIAQKAAILPPESRMGSITDAERTQAINGSLLSVKYSKAYDPDSAYEFLQRRGIEQAEADRKASEEAAVEKQKEKEAATAQKQQEKEEAVAARAQARAAAAAQRDEERKEAAANKAKEREEQKKANAYKRAVKSVGSSVSGTIGREVGKQMGAKFGKFGKTLGGNLGASLGRGILSTLFKM